MNLSGFDRTVRMFTGLGLVTFDYLANADWEIAFFVLGTWTVPGSSTHLTLPTIHSVLISVVAVTLKKNRTIHYVLATEPPR